MKNNPYKAQTQTGKDYCAKISQANLLVLNITTLIIAIMVAGCGKKSLAGSPNGLTRASRKPKIRNTKSKSAIGYRISDFEFFC
jgi:hypothetical protein